VNACCEPESVPLKIMKCTRVERLLPLHVAGDLTGRRARAVPKHLTMCAACRRAAAEFDASRNLLRAEAAALPAEFDEAFYEEIRHSVLARIKRDRTLAPPLSARFPSLFNVRLAYATSLALIIIAVALSLHSFLNRTSEDDRRQSVIAKANITPNGLPAATPTPQVTPAANNGLLTSQVSVEIAGRATGGEARGAKSPSAKGRTRIERARSGAQPSFMLTGNSLPHAGRNSLAPDTGGTKQGTNQQELATGSSGGAVSAQTEVSRIEIQTSDPNIRIIWLSPVTDSAPPLQ